MKYFKLNEHTHVFEANPSEGTLVAHGEGKLTRVEDIHHNWFDRPNWHRIASINLSLYNTDGTRNGCDMENGKWKVKPYESEHWVNFTWTLNKLSILTSPDVEAYSQASIVKGVLPLVLNGIKDTRTKQVSEYAPRTFFGQKEDGEFVMVVTDGRPFGLTFDETFKIARDLKCVNAVMFDGGGSSTMVINNVMVNTNENRKVYDALIFYSTEEFKMAKKVVLDAGHALTTHGKETPYSNELIGGEYPQKYKEAEQNYPIMFKLAEMLEFNGIGVTLTNNNINFDMSLSSRVAIEKAVNPDLFVSIHKNAGMTFDFDDTKGTETYCYKFGANGEKAARLIQEEVIKISGDKDRGVKEGNFQVIRETSSPAVLVELGFMTNLHDAKDMLNNQAQTCYAKGAAKGICRYLGIEFKEKEEATIDESVTVATKDNINALYEAIQGDLKALKALVDTLV